MRFIDEQSKNTDSALFKKLDEYSADLRNAAQEMADLLKQSKGDGHLSKLENLYREIKTKSISEMDVAMHNLETQLVAIRTSQCHGENPFAKLFINKEKLESFLQLQKKFDEEAVKLVEVAAKINGENQ